jgi:hypothetical protein
MNVVKEQVHGIMVITMYIGISFMTSLYMNIDLLYPEVIVSLTICYIEVFQNLITWFHQNMKESLNLN